MLQIALESDAEVAYARLGALCQAIKNELQNDLNIHDASILPAFVNLPQVTAAEYSQVHLLFLCSSSTVKWLDFGRLMRGDSN